MTAAELRIIRERLGVTGDWLAARLGVIPRTVRRWEAGTRDTTGALRDQLQDSSERITQKHLRSYFRSSSM